MRGRRGSQNQLRNWEASRSRSALGRERQSAGAARGPNPGGTGGDWGILQKGFPLQARRVDGQRGPGVKGPARHPNSDPSAGPRGASLDSAGGKLEGAAVSTRVGLATVPEAL